MFEDVTLTNILKFSMLCLKASFGFWGAWLFWRISVPGFEAFLLFAVIWAAGGAYCAGRALHHLTKMLLRMRRMSRLKRKGIDPRADPKAKDDDLRKEGLTR